MRIQIQGRTPYPRSLKWQIHKNYYLKRGMAAWLSGEVPSDVTSNPRQAFQNAMIVFRAVEVLYPKSIPRKQKIYVLEIAAGLGSFCLNFLLEFENICRTHKKTYHQNLVYLMSDIGKRSLEDAAKNRHLQKYVRRGRLEFLVQDSSRPEKNKLLNGRRFIIHKNQLIGVIANYAFCCFKQTVLQKKGDQFSEKYISLWLNSPAKTRGQAMRLLDDPTQTEILKNLDEESDFVPIKLQRFAREEAAQDALLATTRTLPDALFVYPVGPMETTRRLQPLVQPGGVMLINDKGYPRALEMARDYFSVPSFHGNSFAHHLNVPILEHYARGIGFATARTADVHISIQTLMMYKPLEGAAGARGNVASQSSAAQKLPPALAKEFEELFIKRNWNQLTMAWIMAARDCMALEDYADALKYLLWAKPYRPYDYLLMARLGTCYLELGQYKKAIAHFREGESYDYFDRHDFVGAIENVRQKLERTTAKPQEEILTKVA